MELLYFCSEVCVRSKSTKVKINLRGWAPTGFTVRHCSNFEISRLFLQKKKLRVELQYLQKFKYTVHPLGLQKSVHSASQDKQIE